MKTEHDRMLVPIALLVIGVLALALAFAAGCAPEAPEPELACEGDLFCACESDDDCEEHGLGGERGRCHELGFCTIACTSDVQCNGDVAEATCGPLAVLGVPECSLACTELGEPCEALPHASCVSLASDGPAVLACELGPP
jgi:hypothetical protein